MKQLHLIHQVFNFSAARYFKTAGDLFIHQGDYSKALAMVDKTLRLDANNARALVLKADILFCLGRDTDALQVVNEALIVEPAFVEAYLSRAGILETTGGLREALASCFEAEQHITLQNNFLLPALLEQKMTLLIQLRKYGEALHQLEQSAERLAKVDYQRLNAMYRPLLNEYYRQRQTTRRRSGSGPSRQTLRLLQGGCQA